MSGDLKTHLDNGLQAARTKDYQFALEHFLKAYAIDSEDPEVLANIGFAYYKLDKQKQAQLFLKESLRVKPGQEKVLSFLAKSQGFEAISPEVPILPTKQIQQLTEVASEKRLPQKKSKSSRKGRVRHFFTKVVGVTHTNNDGTNRQDIIDMCEEDERLVLEHQRDIPDHPYAIRVSRQSGEQLGYLRSGMGEEIVPKLEKGYKYISFVENITGGRRGKSRGCNIVIIVGTSGATEQAMVDHWNTLKKETKTDNPDPSEYGTGCVTLILLIIIAYIWLTYGC